MQELYRKINSQLSKIERKLLSLLKRFYNKYIRGSINPVAIIKQQRGGYIYEILTDAILSSVFVGVHTLKDLGEVRTGEMIKLIDTQYEQFWKTASKLRMREDELKTVPDSQIVPAGTIVEPEKKPSFSEEAALLGFVGWAAFAALNTGILLSSLGDNPQVIFMTVGDKKVDKKICRPLHGRTFNANDPLLPKPPLHLFCRCMLLPIT